LFATVCELGFPGSRVPPAVSVIEDVSVFFQSVMYPFFSVLVVPVVVLFINSFGSQGDYLFRSMSARVGFCTARPGAWSLIVGGAITCVV